MIEISIYNKFTGMIKRNLVIQEEDIDFQIDKNEEYLEGIYSNNVYYVDIESKELINFPPKPNDYSVFDWDTKQWVDDVDILKSNIDSKRIMLLQASDWTDTVSAQTRLSNYAEWQTYRQALRDIPNQSGYPFNIIWPEQPL